MLTSQFVVQKITTDSKVELYQARTPNLIWHFKTKGLPQPDSNLEIFPFVFHDDVRFAKSFAGSETSLFIRDQKFMVFCDRYALPAGVSVGILFPQRFAPTIFKFADQPVIPRDIAVVPNVSTHSPVYFDIFYNHETRQAAIVFMIGSPIYFEFRCAARYCEDDFPQEQYSSYGDDALKMTLDSEQFGKTYISRSDLDTFSGVLKAKASLDDIRNDMNRLVEIIQSKSASQRSGEISEIKKRLGNVISATGFASSLFSILDSYYGGGVAQKLITKIIAYFML